MKRMRLIPSVLMLVLCIGVLGLGVYAASPTSNAITGTITVNSANNEVLISVFAFDENGSITMIKDSLKRKGIRNQPYRYIE